MIEEILEKMEIRKKVKNIFVYVVYNKKIRKFCWNEKEKFYNVKCDEIEENLKLNVIKKMYDNIKELMGKKKGNIRGGCIKDKDGNMIFERDKVFNRWVEYIGDLFVDIRFFLLILSNDRGLFILKEEVQKVLMNFQFGKVLGDDGIIIEMLKVFEDFGVDKFIDLYNDIYFIGIFFDELLMFVFIILFKQLRVIDCLNYRIISVMFYMFKIFLKII